MQALTSRIILTLSCRHPHLRRIRLAYQERPSPAEFGQDETVVIRFYRGVPLLTRRVSSARIPSEAAPRTGEM
jgi:hypothetical protein